MIDTVGWKSGRHARAISLPVFTGLRGPFDVTRRRASRDQPIIVTSLKFPIKCNDSEEHAIRLCA